jgi:hypothetical protein
MKHHAPQYDLPIPNEPFRLVAETLPLPDPPKPSTPPPDPRQRRMFGYCHTCAMLASQCQCWDPVNQTN